MITILSFNLKFYVVCKWPPHLSSQKVPKVALVFPVCGFCDVWFVIADPSFRMFAPFKCLHLAHKLFFLVF